MTSGIGCQAGERVQGFKGSRGQGDGQVFDTGCSMVLEGFKGSRFTVQRLVGAASSRDVEAGRLSHKNKIGVGLNKVQERGNRESCGKKDLVGAAFQPHWVRGRLVKGARVWLRRSETPKRHPRPSAKARGLSGSAAYRQVCEHSRKRRGTPDHGLRCRFGSIRCGSCRRACTASAARTCARW